MTSASRFVVASLLGTKFHTPVAKRTLNPTYNPKDATFDFPIYLSLADKLGVVELVVWDKDVIKKDYLGEAWIPIEDWFRDGNAIPFNDPSNKVRFIRRTSRARDRDLRAHASPGSSFRHLCSPHATPRLRLETSKSSSASSFRPTPPR